MLATAPCSLNLSDRAFVVAGRRPGTPPLDVMGWQLPKSTSPNDRYAKASEDRIARDQHRALQTGLGDQHPIKWVAMFPGQRASHAQC